MRVPVVAGVGGGVGTTTVAVGLRGHDAGQVAGARPDILICRATLDSMRRAAAVLDGVGPEPPPVLAVALAARAPRRPLRAQLDLLDADAAALVLLPHVPRWGTLVDPLAEAAQLLVEPAARLPRPLRAYAAALRELVAAVAASGRLGHDPADGSARRPGPQPGLPDGRVRRGAAAPAAGSFCPVGGTPQPGAGPVGWPPAAPPPHGGLAPAAADPGQRAGIRIVAPTQARPARDRERGAAAVRPLGAEVAAGRIG
jgi:hypothetical protein